MAINDDLNRWWGGLALPEDLRETRLNVVQFSGNMEVHEHWPTRCAHPARIPTRT